MRNGYFRDKAQQCRAMMAIATHPQLREQLQLWIDEFEHLAEENERQARSRIEHPVAWMRSRVASDVAD